MILSGTRPRSHTGACSKQAGGARACPDRQTSVLGPRRGARLLARFGRKPVDGHDLPRALGPHLALVEEDGPIAFENPAGRRVGGLGPGDDTGAGMKASDVVDERGDQRGSHAATAVGWFADGATAARACRQVLGTR